MALSKEAVGEAASGSGGVGASAAGESVLGSEPPDLRLALPASPVPQGFTQQHEWKWSPVARPRPVQVTDDAKSEALWGAAVDVHAPWRAPAMPSTLPVQLPGSGMFAWLSNLASSGDAHAEATSTSGSHAHAAAAPAPASELPISLAQCSHQALCEKLKERLRSEHNEQRVVECILAARDRCHAGLVKPSFDSPQVRYSYPCPFL